MLAQLIPQPAPKAASHLSEVRDSFTNPRTAPRETNAAPLLLRHEPT